MKGQCVINLLLTRLEIMNMELSLEMGRNIIQTKSGRLKSYKSTCKKLEKKGLKRNVQAALKKIHDLIGVRAICYYVDDIYRIEKKLKEQSDFRIVKMGHISFLFYINCMYLLSDIPISLRNTSLI